MNRVYPGGEPFGIFPWVRNKQLPSFRGLSQASGKPKHWDFQQLLRQIHFREFRMYTSVAF